jgi:hypothetical protein
LDVRLEKMKSPSEAVDLFWKEDFFKGKKKTSEVERKLTGLGINPCNLSDILKKRHYLRYKNGFWIQKHPYAVNNEEIEVYYFEPDKPHTSRKNFVELLSQLSGDVKICDPYLTSDSLEAIEKIANAKVKFLTSAKKSNIKITSNDLKDFKSEFSQVEIKGFPFDHLHDRYIIAKDKLFLLGQGLSIRKKETFIVELPERFAKDLIQSLSATFDIRWKNPNNLILC